jgi:hypothetical protein
MIISKLFSNLPPHSTIQIDLPIVFFGTTNDFIVKIDDS